ncbi:MAG: phosphate acetyltransferase [Gammaproteobacteria bacterium]|nr:phosphate acetyltransferase [Gammaproteobacteria bacterium]
MKTLLLVPTEAGVGLTTICLGLLHALDQQGLRVAFCKPVAQSVAASTGADGAEHTVELIRRYANLQPPAPLPCSQATAWLAAEQTDLLMEQWMMLRERTLAGLAQEPDVLVLEGISPAGDDPLLARINPLLADSFDAQVILVSTPHAQSFAALNQRLESCAAQFGGHDGSDAASGRAVGVILNMLDAPQNEDEHLPLQGPRTPAEASLTWAQIQAQLPVLSTGLHLAGGIPWDAELTAPRTRDVAEFLHAEVVEAGDIQQRRVLHICLATERVGNLLPHLQHGTLVITSADRDEVIVAAALAELNGVTLAGVLLTEGAALRPETLAFCRQAIAHGLPLLRVAEDSYQVITHLPGFANRVPVDDDARIRHVMDTVAQHLDRPWLATLVASQRERRLSPAAFRYSLLQRARAANRLIVLPEGEELRTVRAAVNCSRRGIARCQLLGNPEVIRQLAASNAITLPAELEIVDPVPLRETYVQLLTALRQHKGMTAERARQELEDNVVLGTLMLHEGRVDGLVSGAVHTTANTIRPALQLIRTRVGIDTASSIFFMCLPEQVLIFGDCAINADPEASALADIAIASADSAHEFGLFPRVAMISYSTLDSGTGSDVDKVREATRLVRARRPDLVIDGPLQYDAAVSAEVAATKAPGSPVAGHATVLIFPDLNTGNTTYKAVQRSAGVVSIGPMLQGLNKPVNDLSRGASVEDIVYTIAITAIQATIENRTIEKRERTM